MAIRRLSAKEATDALARHEDFERADRGPVEHRTPSLAEAAASVPPEEAEEGHRKREWRRRMRESRAALAAAPAYAKGMDEMVRRGGKIRKVIRGGKVIDQVEFPEGGMR